MRRPRKQDSCTPADSTGSTRLQHRAALTGVDANGICMHVRVCVRACSIRGTQFNWLYIELRSFENTTSHFESTGDTHTQQPNRDRRKSGTSSNSQQPSSSHRRSHLGDTHTHYLYRSPATGWWCGCHWTETCGLYPSDGGCCVCCVEAAGAIWQSGEFRTQTHTVIQTYSWRLVHDSQKQHLFSNDTCIFASGCLFWL